MAQSVKEVCSCGATFEAQDTKGHYINGGNPDEAGRVFQIEVQVEHWRNNHKCKEKQ